MLFSPFAISLHKKKNPHPETMAWKDFCLVYTEHCKLFNEPLIRGGGIQEVQYSMHRGALGRKNSNARNCATSLNVESRNVACNNALASINMNVPTLCTNETAECLLIFRFCFPRKWRQQFKDYSFMIWPTFEGRGIMSDAALQFQSKRWIIPHNIGFRTLAIDTSKLCGMKEETYVEPQPSSDDHQQPSTHTLASVVCNRYCM